MNHLITKVIAISLTQDDLIRALIRVARDVSPVNIRSKLIWKPTNPVLLFYVH